MLKSVKVFSFIKETSISILKIISKNWISQEIKCLTLNVCIYIFAQSPPHTYWKWISINITTKEYPLIDIYLEMLVVIQVMWVAFFGKIANVCL